MVKLLTTGLIAATFGAAALPAAARTNVDFFVNVGPPPVFYEQVAAPRVGLIWVPGYWEGRHGRHYWVRGHYTRYRPGYVYAPARWRDRDGDGVPNHRDRFPDNPYRR